MVAVELLAGWLPRRSSGPVVVVAGPVVLDATVVVVGVWLVVVDTRVVVGPVVGGVLVVVDMMLVVVTRVVVGAAVVVGLAVVGGAVAVSWLVVASEDEGAVPVVAPSTLAGAGAVAGRAVVGGPVMAPCSGPWVVEGGGAVVGSWSPVVVVVVVIDAAVGAGLVGEVGSATPGARRGGWGWGSRVAEATRAARIAVVSPKMNSSSLQGRGGLARCRGGGVGMGRRPGSAGSSGS